MTPAKVFSEMKDSGIEWVGMIPNHWTTIANKYVMHKEKHICEKWDGQDVLSLTMNGVIIRDILNPVGKMPTTFDGYQFAYAGELLMCLFDIDVTPRCVGRVFNDGVTSPAYSCFQLNDNADLGYFYYYYLMVDNTKELLHLAKNLRHSFTEEQLGQLKVPLPPLQEQSAIASYLDAQCAKIDEIIAQAKASIEDYKQWKASIIYEAVTKGLDPNVEMKDSGVEWIGKVPKEWKAIPLKVCTSKIGSGKTPQGGAETYQDNGVLFLRSQNVYNTGLELDGVYYISDEIDSTMKNSRVRYNDVLLNITGGSIGRCCLFDLPDTAANVNQHVCIIRTKPEILLSQFLRYFWNSAAGPMVIDQYQTGSNRQGLNFEQIGATHIPLCSIAEQRQIVAMLDQKCAVIDQLMAEKQSLIDDLESYKKSLIYEVVTGKRRVISNG